MIEHEIRDEMLEEFVSFIKERYSVFLKKEAGEPKPWTQNAILQKYRFCNVHRENDKVTRWITDNWLEFHASDPDVWFAMVIARHLNQPESLEDLGYPVPWNPEHFLAVIARRKAAKLRNYNGAYMIGTGGNTIDKSVYLADRVFAPLWAARETLRPKVGDTLTSYHFILGQFYGLASFLTAQVIADIRWVEPLRSASDWWTFAASGPGSRRGLNRLIERPINTPWREDDWRTALSRLQNTINPRLAEAGVPELHAQNVQNCLCEIDKLLRVKLGEGRPRQLYSGAA